MRIGLISDTHGRVHNEVFDVFRDVERILHAGDIGPPDILVELEAIAPVTAVFGNTDGGAVRARLDDVARISAGGYRIAVIHGHQLGTPKPDGLRAALPDTDIIVYGHTHRPLVDRQADTLVINPGSAGAPRFGLYPSVAVVDLEADLEVELIDLR